MPLGLLRINQQLPLVITNRRRIRLKGSMVLLKLLPRLLHRDIMARVDSSILGINKPQHDRPRVLALHPEGTRVRRVEHRHALVPRISEPDEAGRVAAHGQREGRGDRVAEGSVRLRDVRVADGLVACQSGVGALEAVVLQEIAVDSAVACVLSVRIRFARSQSP